MRVEEILSRFIWHLGEVRRVGRDFLEVLERCETDMDRWSMGRLGRGRRGISAESEVDLACNVDTLDLLVAENDIDGFVYVCAQTGLVGGGGTVDRRRGHRTADPDGGRIKGIVGSDG